MIDLKRAELKRIKRANTDWWINEKACTAENSMTYIAYMNDTGEIRVKEMSAKCSKIPSRDVCLRRINCTYADEHNAPSLCVTKDGRLIVAYTGHNQNGGLRLRISARPYDITSFGPEKTLGYDGEVTYSQIFENDALGQIWIFTRVGGVTWQFRYSRDMGESFSEPVTILASDQGGLFYMNIRKQLAASAGEACERWFFAVYGHPYLSKDHSIHCGIIDADGSLRRTDGKTAMSNHNLFDDTALMEIDGLEKIYEAPGGKTVRLLNVALTEPLRVGIAVFEASRPVKAELYVLRLREEWSCSACIAEDCGFLAPGQTDGSQTYVGGMDFYFGVGDAGFTYHGGDCESDRIFLARSTGSRSVLESYVSHDRGASYEPEQTVYEAPAEGGVKLWRPTVPAFAQDNMPVYWHEGTYYAHTGGWHCDVDMMVEYDD